jgi:hypothetical protein
MVDQGCAAFATIRTGGSGPNFFRGFDFSGVVMRGESSLSAGQAR